MRRWISDTFKCLDIMILRDGAKFGEEFRKWESKVDVSEDLAKQVKAMGRQFVFQFMMNVRHRLQPYWRVILAMETINPCSPYKVSPDAWLGVIDLCKRVDMSDARACVKDLQAQHETGGEWSMAEVKACNANLLKFYHDRLVFDNKHNKLPDYPLANNFATLIISLHIASAIIESFFSKTRVFLTFRTVSIACGLQPQDQRTPERSPWFEQAIDIYIIYSILLD